VDDRIRMLGGRSRELRIEAVVLLVPGDRFGPGEAAQHVPVDDRLPAPYRVGFDIEAEVESVRNAVPRLLARQHIVALEQHEPYPGRNDDRIGNHFVDPAVISGHAQRHVGVAQRLHRADDALHIEGPRRALPCTHRHGLAAGPFDRHRIELLVAPVPSVDGYRYRGQRRIHARAEPAKQRRQRGLAASRCPGQTDDHPAVRRLAVQARVEQAEDLRDRPVDFFLPRLDYDLDACDIQPYAIRLRSS